MYGLSTHELGQTAAAHFMRDLLIFFESSARCQLVPSALYTPNLAVRLSIISIF